MKVLVLFWFTFCVATKVNYANFKMPGLKLPKIDLPMMRAEPVIETMRQRIDHFSFFDRRTFTMRYTSNAEFFNGTGPMFVLVGGESYLEDSISFLYVGLMAELAQQLGAYMFLPEHRYYGESIPYSNLNVINLRHLTVKQALADLAAFIQDRKNSISELQNSSVVVFGGSYPGILAAWMRLKYPDIVDAAHSSSGIFNLKVDNYEFNEVVQNSLSPFPGCLSTIKNGVAATQNLLKTSKGMDQVTQDYNWPSNAYLFLKVMQQSFFSTIMYIIDVVVQYNRNASYLNMQSMCTNLTQNSNTSDDYTRLANYIAPYMAQLNSDTSTADANVGRAWQYQVCTELGSFVTTDSKNQPYSNTVPVSYWKSVCLMTFGMSANPARTNHGVHQLRQTYGGPNINVTKVVFTVGTVDPWSGIGLKKSPNPEAPLIIIQGGSHCADMSPASTSNSAALTKARAMVKQYITSWIQ